MHRTLALPVHPTNRHPLTGQPLRAVCLRRDGSPVWPILGGDDTVVPADGQAAADADAAGAAASGAQAGAAGGTQNATDDQGNDLGYPANTRVAEMTAEQQASYWRHHAQKHEGRYKSLVGDRSFDDAKTALEQYAEIQRQQMTPAEQALTAAREEGKTEGITTERRKAATAIFKATLEAKGLEEADVAELTANFSVDGYITDDGVDTTKIANFAARFAKSGTDETDRRRRDFGGGNRGGGQQPTTRGSRGKAEAQKRFGGKTTTGE